MPHLNHKGNSIVKQKQIESNPSNLGLNCFWLTTQSDLSGTHICLLKKSDAKEKPIPIWSIESSHASAQSLAPYDANLFTDWSPLDSLALFYWQLIANLNFMDQCQYLNNYILTPSLT